MILLEYSKYFEDNIVKTLSHLQLSVYHASIQNKHYPTQIGCVLDLSSVAYNGFLLTNYLQRITDLNQGLYLENNVPYFKESKAQLEITPISYEEKDAFLETPFSLEGGLLYRVGYDDKNHKLIFVSHHILLDGISIQYLMCQIFRLFQGQPVDHFRIQSKKNNPDEANLNWFIDQINKYEPTFIKKDVPKGELHKGERISVPIHFKTKRHLPLLIEAAVALYLRYLNDQESVRYGIVYSQRTSNSKTALGMFSQAYPIQIDFTGNRTIESLLKHIELSHLSILRRRFIPFEPLLNVSKKVHQTSSLFDVTVIDQTLNIDENTPLEPLFYPLIDQSLIINIWNRKSPQLFMDYATDAYTKTQIDSFIHQLLKLIQALDTSETLDDCPVVSKNTIDDHLETLPNLLGIYYQNLEIHLNDIAIVDQDEYTYEQLEIESNQLSHYFNQLEVPLIILKGQKSYEAILGMLAAIKARKPFVFRTSETAQYLEEPLDIDRKHWKDYPKTKLNHSESEILAYYFTSGTTKRKQVAIKTSGLAHHLSYAPYIQTASKLTAIPLLSKLHFDMSLEEIWVALKHKLKLVILNDDTFMDIKQRSRVLNDHPIDGITTTPSILHILYEQNKEIFENLKWVVSGGSSLTSALGSNLLNYPNLKLYNSYGPTETTIAVSSTLITKALDIPIGKPHLGVHIQILNSKPMPYGEIGQICIAGPILSPSIPTITIEGLAYYETGDYGYQTEDQTVYYVGRKDRQIKRFDQRIDLNFIDMTIQKHPLIIGSYSEFIDNQIVTSYQTTRTVEKDELWVYIKENLPLSHCPNQLINTNLITPEGKMKKASISKKTIFIPKKSVEKVFVRVLNQLLATKSIYHEDTWTELGGDSLIAVQTLAILDQYHIQLDVQSLLKGTIAEMVKSLKKTTTDYSRVTLLNEVSPISNLECVCLYGGNGFLGIHLLNTFIKESDSKIICPLRVSLEALKEDYLYYTETPLDETRVKVIPFESSLETETIDLIINAAGHTMYNGSKADYEFINMAFVQNLANVSIDQKIPLIHISTTGIGLYEFNFKETTTKLRRHFLNPYLQSKASTEIDLLAKTSPWIRIIRVGNLTPSLKKFKSERRKKNAFIQSLSKIDFDFTLSMGFDITPVDVASKAIWTSMKFNSQITHILNPNIYGVINGAITHIKIVYPIKSNQTQTLLKINGFNYPEIPIQYLTKIIELAQKNRGA